jgi:hypothetical protein
MIPIIEIFLGLSIGIAILWVTVLALLKFTRRVMSGEEWQEVLKDFWIYQPKSRGIPEATDKRGEKIFEPKTHCEIGFALEAFRSLCHVLLTREMA